MEGPRGDEGDGGECAGLWGHSEGRMEGAGLREYHFDGYG